MNEQGNMKSTNRRRLGWGAGLVAAAAVGAALLMGALPASAATGTTGSSAASGTSSGTGATSSASAPAAPAVPGERSDETVLTGTLAAKAKAAALKAVPGATVVKVETDADGATYEAHMKKADGSLVTVKFDKNMAVTAVQAGMGSGGGIGGGVAGGTGSGSA